MPPRLRAKAKQDQSGSATMREISVSDKNVDIGATPQISPRAVSPVIVFSLLLALRLCSAARATIPDCDEVFNYWEPAHYLSHGYGLQTWEYSPTYAIRSWAYVGLHAVASRALALIAGLDKIYEFYSLRCLFAAACAYSETRLYSAISKRLHTRIGMLFLAATVSSAGMFHAATAFLPSTFAMYTTMLGMAAFIERDHPSSVVWGIAWYALGGILGWPFSLVMPIPFLLQEFILGLVNGQSFVTALRFVKGSLVSFVILVAVVTVDFFAYRKFEIIPLNIVLYNVFSGGSEKGPNIYGTEPWWFYLANLGLNFNLLLPQALASTSALAVSLALRPQSVYFSASLLALTTPFYLWLLIFTLQPHKEERFMFVAYPALSVNAAISYHLIFTTWESVSNRFIPTGKPRQILNWALFALSLAPAALISVLRVLAVVTAYSAPMTLYTSLPPTATGNLCIAKEWYRFPSSYFLPHGVRAKFLKSSFDGLLPGQFPEGSGWERPGTWMIPEGMNDENKEDMGKYVPLEKCDFLVESYFAGRNEEDMKENYKVEGKEGWEKVRCERFLDAANTPALGRIVWMPRVLGDRRKWGDYCLFERSGRVVKETLKKG